jgi:hypothetical protein
MIAPAEKVLIIGKAPSSRGLAPYDDTSWEVWTLSDLVPRKQVPRFERHIEVHPLSVIRDRGDGYFSWLQSIRDKPVYLREEDKGIPAGIVLPWMELAAKYGNYCTNTVTWMIVLAIEAGAKQIGVWGVDMAQDPLAGKNGEYVHQRPSCEYIIGYARGRGIEVTIPPQCDLMKCRLQYGIETDGGELLEKWKAKDQEIRQRLANAENQAQQAQQQAAFLHGCRDMTHYFRQWVGEDWSGI